MILIKNYKLQDHTPGKGNWYVTFPAMFAAQHGLTVGSSLFCYIQAPRPKSMPDLVFIKEKRKRGDLVGEFTISSAGKRGLQIKVPQRYADRVRLSQEKHSLNCYVTTTAVHYNREKITNG